MRRVAGLVLLLLLGPAALAAPGKSGPIQWKRTYADALLEARIRGVPVLVFRHTDECGRCLRQRRRVMEDETFVRWANVHLVCLPVHDARLHDAVDVEVGGKKVSRCPLYPGLSCRDHVRAAVDVSDARNEDLVKVPTVPLIPNTWFVDPTGEAERVPEKKQFDPKAIRTQGEALQKKLGSPLDRKHLASVRRNLQRAETESYDEDWRKALEALAAIERIAPKPPKSLRTLIQGRMALIDEYAGYQAEDVLEAETVTPEITALARRLVEALDVPVYGTRVPLRAKLDAWLAKRP